jgi:hypothetical protein
MSSVVFLLFFLLSAAQKPDGVSPHCAATVIVKEPNGQPWLGNTEVALLNRDGDAVQKKTLVNGRVTFCDFGFGLHSILIGSPTRCGSAQILNVRFLFPAEQVFVATINMCKQFGGSGIAGGCFLHLRAVDQDGHPVPNPVATSSGRAQSGTAGGFIPFGLRLNGTTRVRITAPGFQEAVIDKQCPVPALHEQVVVMERQMEEPPNP